MEADLAHLYAKASDIKNFSRLSHKKKKREKQELQEKIELQEKQLKEREQVVKDQEEEFKTLKNQVATFEARVQKEVKTSVDSNSKALEIAHQQEVALLTSSSKSDKQLLESVLRIRPDHVEALRRLWHLEAAAGNARQAEAYRQRFVALSPLDAEALKPH